VREALASLPGKQKEAVVLRYYECLTYDEIGEVMGTSRKGVERLLARGRAALGTLLSGILGK
jgi:RNA polymerase sigma-70 factor (ECF subfamily)